MNDNHNYRKYAAIYARQGMLSLILLIFTIYLTADSSLNEILFLPTIENVSILESEKYRSKNPVVRIHAKTLYYTGYDNEDGKKATGHYYYMLQDGRCLLVLLDSSRDKPQKILKDYTAAFRLIEDDTLDNQLLTSMAADMEWSSQSFMDITLPVLASQPDYHPLIVAMLVILLISGSVIFLLSVIFNFQNYRKCMHRHLHLLENEQEA